MAQIYDREQNPMNGRVYSEEGIAPTLRTPTGGLSEPKIMQIGSYSPSSQCNAKVLDTDSICPTLLDHKGAEPAIIEQLSCAMRGRNPDNPSDRTAGINTEQRLELGGDVANCLTSVQKDSMVAEICILGYTRDDKGGIQNYHERDVAGTIHTSSGSGGNTDQFVKEAISRQDNIAFKEMPDGNIRAYDASTPDKRGVSELQITNADNIAPTLTTSHEPKVLLKYRIRKLCPIETGRLMGLTDENFYKMANARIPHVLKSGQIKYRPMGKSALYRLHGNSIVVDVLYYIFRQMFIAEPPKPQSRQLTLFD